MPVYSVFRRIQSLAMIIQNNLPLKITCTSLPHAYGRPFVPPLYVLY